MGCSCNGPCGNLDMPPSRSNLSIFAIIELVVMGVVGVLCAVDLYYYFKDSRSWDYLTLLKVIDCIIIVAGLVLIIVGLFCCIGTYQIRTGIICFCVGCILAIIITVIILVKGYNKDSMIFNVCYIVLLVVLAYILWRQSNHLSI